MGLSKNTLDRSDISTYPIKLKYSASYASSSAVNYGITLNRGINGSFVSNDNDFLVYKLAKQLYYNSYLTGSLNDTASAWNDNLQSTAASGTFDNDYRYFPTASGDEITVLAIPRTVFGENISRKSLRISGSTYYLIDDGNGNVVDINNNNVHVGNILYAQGIVVITNLDYEYALIQTTTTTTTTSTTSTTTTVAPTTTTTTTIAPTTTTTTTTTIAPTTTTTTSTTTVAPTTTTTSTTTVAPTTTTTSTTTIAPTTTTTSTTTIAPTTTSTTTIAPTTSTTTSTTTVASTNHFRSVTPQSSAANACLQSTPNNIYTSVATSNIAIGITFYSDANLTTTFNGANQWFKILWKGVTGFDDIYAVQIDSSGQVLNWEYCPSPTTTTSTTTVAPTTSTTTTSTTIEPTTTTSTTTITPSTSTTTTSTTIEPTTTTSTTTVAPTTSTTTSTTTVGSTNHFRSATPQLNSTNACAQSTPTNIYTSIPDDTMSVGITFYSNANLSSTFDGNNQWFKILWKGAIGFDNIYAVQINSSGVVQDFLLCSSITTTTTSTTTTTTTIEPTTTTTSTTTTTTTIEPTTTTTSTTTTTTTIACYEYVATADQTDIDNSDNQTVYFDYVDCDGLNQTLSRGTTTPSNPICAQSVGSVYILIGGNASAVFSSAWSLPGSQCNVGGGGGGETP
jgi:hypothetical protein